MELTSFNSLIEIFNVYKNLILWFGSISLFVFLFSLLSIKWLVSLIPEDYFINKKDKLTRREQVYEFIKSKSSTNEEISEELNMPLSSVCARVRELQVLDLVLDSGLRRETKYGKQAIVWQIKK